jgi:hypothetical protein
MAQVVKLAVAVAGLSAAAYAGTGDARIRLWPDRGALICDVTDPGVVTDPMIGRTVVSTGTARDRAVRMANELCDLVQTRSTADGTTTRIHTWRISPLTARYPAGH